MRTARSPSVLVVMPTHIGRDCATTRPDPLLAKGSWVGVDLRRNGFRLPGGLFDPCQRRTDSMVGLTGRGSAGRLALVAHHGDAMRMSSIQASTGRVSLPSSNGAARDATTASEPRCGPLLCSEHMPTERTETLNALTAPLRVADIGIDVREPLMAGQTTRLPAGSPKTSPRSPPTSSASGSPKRVGDRGQELATNPACITSLIQDSSAAVLLDRNGLGPITVLSRNSVVVGVLRD